MQKKTQFHQKKECCAGALEGAFLKSLVRLTHAKTVLEVGMFTGTSSLAMAEALPTDGKVAVTQPHADSSAAFCTISAALLPQQGLPAIPFGHLATTLTVFCCAAIHVAAQHQSLCCLCKMAICSLCLLSSTGIVTRKPNCKPHALSMHGLDHRCASPCMDS